MSDKNNSKLKSQVHNYWNKESCDTHSASSKKFSREYFEEIESYRYSDQPFIHSFAQFSRYHGKRVLEVGFGAGTDFIQWLRAGAQASGIDLTEEGLENLTHRIHTYGLPSPECIKVADAENLPFESNSFDLGYSFGVLHHSPDTLKAIQELVRVIRPGGDLKIMLYNRNSICAVNAWVRHALLRGQPWKSVKWALFHHVESAGTKAYTKAELHRMLSPLGLRNINIQTEVTSADFLASSVFPPLNLLYRGALWLAGQRHGWKLSDFQKSSKRKTTQPEDILDCTGNPLGWFHCISAEKTLE